MTPSLVAVPMKPEAVRPWPRSATRGRVPSPALGSACAGAAVGHPQVLRRHRHDARRHQPGRRRARLHHAAADRRGGRPLAALAAGRTTPATTARSSCAARSPSTWSGCTASATTRRRRSCVTVGASEALAVAMAAIIDPGDEVMLHEPSYVAYMPGDHLQRRRAGAGADTSPSDGWQLDAEQRRGGHHAAHQGAVPGLPLQPDRRRAVARDAARSRGHRARATTCIVVSDEIYDRLVYGGHRHDADQLAAGHARAHDPARRLLQGLRHDRLARRLRVRAAGPPRGHRSRSTSTRSCRRPRRPRMPPLVALTARRAGRRSGWSASTTGAGGCSSRASTASACRRSSRRARSTPSRDIRSSGLTSEQFSERLLFEHKVAVIPGSAFGPSGEGHVRATLATSYEHLEEALVAHRAVLVSSLG